MDKLLEGSHLTEEEMTDAMEAIMEGEVPEVVLGSFLTALRIKGEGITELTAGAKVMRNKAEKMELAGLYTVDTCGTGGDCAGTYNISTAVAFIAAAAGIHVAKHGNRSVSSKSGSADVLEALGAVITLSPQQVASSVHKHHIGFLFAPVFHKAMKHAIGVRRALGFRTVFNMLGPLTNPAEAKGQVMGVYDQSLTEAMAAVLKNLGTDHALVVHGMDGLDEITTTTQTKVTELKDGILHTYYITPEQFGMSRSNLEDLRGGSAVENAAIIRALLQGEQGPKREILLLNSGAALYVGKKANSLGDGIKLAATLIDTGMAMEKMNEYIDFTKSIAS